MRPDLFLLHFATFKLPVCIFTLLFIDLSFINSIFYFESKRELSLMKIAYKSPVHKVINFLKTAATIGRKNVAEPKYG